MKAPLWVGKSKYWQARFIRLKTCGYKSCVIEKMIKEERARLRAKPPVNPDLKVGAEEMAAAGYSKSVIRANFAITHWKG